MNTGNTKKAFFHFFLFSLLFISCHSTKLVQDISNDGNILPPPKPTPEKSLPALPKPLAISPLSLLDNKSTFYLRIPSSADEVLLEKIIGKFIPSEKSSDAKSVAKRIDVVYAGLNRSDGETIYQVALNFNIPKFIIDKSFREQSGWEKSSTSFGITTRNDDLSLPDAGDSAGEDTSREGSEVQQIEYEIFNNELISLSFPTKDIMCLGRDIEGMLWRFHRGSYPKNTTPSAESENFLEAEIYDFLYYDEKHDDGRIKFFANRPQSFLTLLTGATLNFNLLYVSGFMERSKENKNAFITTLDFEFKNSRLVRAALGTLRVAFSLASSNITLTTPTHLTVSGIEIPKKRLYEIFLPMVRE